MDSDTARVWTEESIAGLELYRLFAVGCKLTLQKVLNNIKERCREVFRDTQQKLQDREAYKNVLTWFNKAGSISRVLEELMQVKKDDVVGITDTTTSIIKLFMELFNQEIAKALTD